LLFLHWEVPQDLLRALVPAALEIDTYQGRAYAAVVPFKMRRIRLGLAVRERDGRDRAGLTP
jgi:uncharacterized protein YqjF (DUF2071 family)